MKFTFNNNEYRITFAYPVEKRRRNRVIRRSVARVFRADGQVAAEGIVTLYAKDRFVYSEGRKQALIAALEKSDREFRTAVWAAYDSRKNSDAMTTASAS
jgi:hypothetical protein